MTITWKASEAAAPVFQLQRQKCGITNVPSTISGEGSASSQREAKHVLVYFLSTFSQGLNQSRTEQQTAILAAHQEKNQQKRTKKFPIILSERERLSLTECPVIIYTLN